MDGLAFTIAGIIVVLGFVGNYLFQKTRVPDILLLVAFGFILGPVFRVMEPTAIEAAAPILASLALLIILFEGGLNLNLQRVIKESPRAMMLSLLGVSISALFTTFFTAIVLGWSPMESLLLGVILGGTSSSVVLPLISRTKTPPRITALLSLESVFTDAIVIVVGITLIQVIGSSPSADGVLEGAHGIASAFSIGGMAGLISGIVWLRAMKSLKGETYDDVLTLAVLILMYGVVESIRGNGAIFALSFGLVLGNGKEIGKIFRIDDTIEAGRITKKFMSQMSFFIRTFFFVYLGFIMFVSDYLVIVYSIMLSVMLILSRFLATALVSLQDSVLQKNRSIIAIMVPRGLAAAVLAQLVITAGLPHARDFSDIIIVVIVATVGFAAVAASVLELHVLNSKEEEEKKEEKKE